MIKREEPVQGYRLTIFGRQVGVLARFAGQKNILTFDPDYVADTDEAKPLVSAVQLIDPEKFFKPHIRKMRLPPLLSNLLPEGALREYHASLLKVGADDEFRLLAAYADSLPGAIVAEPLANGMIPTWALAARDQAEPIQIPITDGEKLQAVAGVQMKFSTIKDDGRFHITNESGSDDWIVKTPSTKHPFVPANEYSAMKLAEAVLVDIPEVKLPKLSEVDELPNIQLPDEQWAYSIKRFDRVEGTRIHSEDFAQIFNVYPRAKYDRQSYETLAEKLIEVIDEEYLLEDFAEFVRRLTVNILVGNGDAHLKNFSLLYEDGYKPRLSPAYDILSTLVYIKGEKDFALNLAGNKNWYEVKLDHFRQLAEKLELGDPEWVVDVAQTTIEAARMTWPDLLEELPMFDAHKELLRKHWLALPEEFRIKP